MSFASRLALIVVGCIALPSATFAGPISDFSSGYSSITNLGTDETFASGITASAWYFDTASQTWKPSILTARNETNDHGLGVCSEPADDCNFGGGGSGDFNELSQLSYTEAILLERPDDTSWAELWLSSLDNNDGSTSLGAENGLLYWGNTSSIAALLAGTAFPFGYPAFTGTVVEGRLTLPGGFDPFAQYVLFLPGGLTGTNNDYLVWGATLATPRGDLPPVPEPASILLLGSGLLAVARRVRRARKG